MKTLERLYESYIDEKNEQAEVGPVYEAMKEYRKTLENDGSASSKLQSVLWDNFVMYGDARERDGFMAGFKMAMQLQEELRA